MYYQTICFIKRNDELLMLNRDYTPTQGLWNGVGGKMKENEKPLECLVREVKEETGIDISSNNITYKGIVSWEIDNTITGGMYAFLVTVPVDYEYQTPKKIDEGILDWKKITWLLDGNNLGVGEMIPHVLPNLLKISSTLHHKCELHKKKLTKYEFTELLSEKKMRF
ncbi:NUDIX hydrolase [Jeotgalibacillus proteolyticus]|uniref:DNA mismatch repair protein MutT n=1 Tax=Jeotgalibacillus proteolyticus TaxID=2082395 RepID=A0A2S5G9E1_9BACL|nr:8-oxo-dGTP diphosphatase [Jeotgalibacillus proteolyticus]PPA69555.1 DNA mismatch repair protein MutT [Jeotgalibacillus proteolyticus]